jgi:hypothetical protein
MEIDELGDHAMQVRFGNQALDTGEFALQLFGANLA